MAHENQASGMIYHTLGSTGQRVSAIGLGGFHIGVIADEKESIRVIRSAIDRGITFLDNAWDYHNGRSELRMGRALRDGYRDRVFLMTKVDGRTKQAAAQQLDQSLQRLQTDHVDLIQIHETIRWDDPDRVFAEGGAMEALLAAKKAGKVRYIGFTGHKDPDIHLKMLRTAFAHGFTFDTVQMPLNLLDGNLEHSFERLVLPALVQNEIGVLGMKPICAGKLMETHTVSAIDCLHYALSLPTDVVITGCDSMPVLDQAIEAASAFKPLTDSQRAELLRKTYRAAQEGKFEEYKNTHLHDSTSTHPEWLTTAA